MNDEKEDDSPWDDDDGARTLATSSPAFESNIPSPISVPPPPAAPPPAAAAPPAPPNPPKPMGSVGAVRPLGTKMAPKATLVGLNPADFMKSLPRVGSSPRLPSSADPPPSSRRGSPTDPDFGPEPDFGPAEDDEDEDDGPTMLGGSAPQPQPQPQARVAEKNAARGSRPDLGPPPAKDEDDEPLPDLSSPEDGDETTRAAQMASVVVGQGAVGDEATLAIAPGTFEAVPGASASAYASLGPALPPQGGPRPGSQPRIPAGVAGLHGGPPPYAGPIPDPLLPSSPMFGAPQAAWQGQGNPYPQPGAAPWPSPPYGAPLSMQQPGTAPAPWLAQQPQPPHGFGAPHGGPGYPAPLAPPAPPSPRFQITPQVMLLAGVGFVCFAIFIVGVVLFITSKG
ncbi:MAG: hypothetical protein JWP97_514 [Labilithrix sp.]|nr:hypothetical protein [Labilithrix sp.]